MNRFSLTPSTLALFDFSQRTLEDFSGHGIDLEGTHKFREVAPQVWELAPGSDIFRPVRDALLALTGEMTVEVSGTMYSAPGLLTLVGFLGSGETLATNAQWLLGTQDAHRLRWFQEHGGGTDAPASPLAALNASESLPAPGCDFIATGVRHADGSVSVFLNGRLHARSAPLTAPAGGTSAVLRVMAGATAFGLRGIRISGVAMTPAEVADSAAAALGLHPLTLGKLWVGAVSHNSARVVARMAGPVAGLTLTIDDGVTQWETDPVGTDSDNVARFDLTGLTPGADHAYSLPCGVTGGFRTHAAAAGTPCSFSVAFGGDTIAGSTHPIWAAIEATDPDLCLIIGDWGYANITANNPVLFHGLHDDNFAAAAQHRLCRNVPTQTVADDHDGAGGNDTDGSAVAWPAYAAVYRSRVPHYPLPHVRATYQTWDVGRVRFIMTDQRSEAGAGTILGATQKAWWKDLITNSPGMAIVWICPRWFANANHADSWNSYPLERAELCDHIKAHAHGRVQVWEADQHTGAIDDGTNVDHATGGGEPLRCFRAAPLDKEVSALGGTYSHGEFATRGQFGLVRVTDTGGPTVDFEWELRNAAGAVLTSYAFPVTV